MVPRHLRIRVKYVDENAEKQEAELSGFTARVFQHEIDHLNGVLYIDYLKPVKRTVVDAKITKVQRLQAKQKSKVNGVNE